MNRSILIVDDDQGFSDLLKGIFEQADYTVHTAFSAEQGLEMLEKVNISLIVSDHRLPGGITGTEFLTLLRKSGVHLPVIVVSGFLNDEAIRELIRDGVAGIFIKPLNIFSLLKKAQEILEEKEKENSAGDEDENGVGGYSLGGICGDSERGADFLARARKAAAFRRNLLLIGPKGIMFEAIARDIVNLAEEKQRCEFIGPGSVSPERLDALLAGELSSSPVTLVVTDAENLSEDEIEAILDFGDAKGGSDSPLRMIFCLSRSVEELYEDEVIDDEFYLFLGANELQIPSLIEMPEDLVGIARKEIEKQADGVVFDIKLRTLLLSHQWEENFVELKSVIVRAVTLAQPMSPTIRHFEAALDPNNSSESSLKDVRSTFELFLLQEKRHYEEALAILTESD